MECVCINTELWKIPMQHQFSRSVMSDSLRPHGLQHTRPPCPSPTPGVYSNSCPLSRWCHPTIPSSVVPFSSHLQSFPASGSFQMSQLFASGGQSIGVSASITVLPMNIQDDFHPCNIVKWKTKLLNNMKLHLCRKQKICMYFCLSRQNSSERFCNGDSSCWMVSYNVEDAFMDYLT